MEVCKKFGILAILFGFFYGVHAQGRIVSWSDIADLPIPKADHRISYGKDELQFGDLRLPTGAGPFPVAVVIHGGCWRSENDLNHISHLSASLTKSGIATWTIEYRRIGDKGGGWPGTFEDVGRATDYLQELTKKYPLDLNRILLVGHSAGAHLALWTASRHQLPQKSPLFSSNPIEVKGVISLAGITDLREYGKERGYCNVSVSMLLGGSPEEFPERYAQANPIELLPIDVPVRLLHGTRDSIVPVEQSQMYAKQGKSKGDDAQLQIIQNAGHFDLIAPFSSAWNTVEIAVRSLL